jgi:hypothetical protein
MEAVGELHGRGYSRLKLYCYIKEGLGRWRHILVAADDFPEEPLQLPGECVLFEPADFAFRRDFTDPFALADDFESQHSFFSHARGLDEAYVTWYREMLEQTAPWGIIMMESPDRASFYYHGGMRVRATQPNLRR